MDSPIGKGRGGKRRSRGRGGEIGMRDDKKWPDPRRGRRRRRHRRRCRRASPPQRLHRFPVIFPLILLFSSINNQIFYQICSCKKSKYWQKNAIYWLDRGVTYGREKRWRGWQRPGQWNPSPPPHLFTSRRRCLSLNTATLPTSTASTSDFQHWYGSASIKPFSWQSLYFRSLAGKERNWEVEFVFDHEETASERKEREKRRNGEK